MTKWILFLLSGLSLFAAPPDPQAVKEVMAASDAWKLAMMKKDAAGLQKLMHEDMIYSHSSGMMQTKADVIKATTTGKTVIEAMDFSETTVRVYGNMALIRANVEMRNATDGKATTYHTNVLHVWLKGPDGWQMVSRQATQLSPPTPVQ
jgi:ketosteroid isomerase-like protein